MKKKVFGFICCFAVLILVGCGKENAELKTSTCTLYRNDVINNYKLESTYEISYLGDVVKKVKSNEKVTSDSEEIISQFETTLNSTYSTMSEVYGGYDYKITKDNGSVTADVTIDYEKLNLEQLSKDDSTMSSIMNDNNEILKDELQEMYESIGAECE